ncbi:ATP-binding protein [Rummeliibacillus pycnus]|uniref:ATP-binding protein n=1 Tax=Rummeliibacillus pycnus TaxID=101070 RepID=UPI000C9B9542|nr:ATP-binding protein [Rummeliibacillus pycnus]
MEPIINSLQKNILMALTSNECLKHGKPMPIMMIDGVEVCPKCELEKEDVKFRKKLSEEAIERERNKRKNTLYYRSFFRDKSIKDAGFKNFKIKTAEEAENLRLARQAVAHYKTKKVFTTLFQGNTGAGKSHLAMAIVRNLNETLNDVECVFVNVRSMIMEIKDSWRNEDNPHTSMYFADLLSRVDFLVLDDLGNESADDKANKTVLEILTEVLESRQDKATIITTNCTREQLERIYTKALISRTLKITALIIFEKTNDKRIKKYDLDAPIEEEIE